MTPGTVLSRALAIVALLVAQSTLRPLIGGPAPVDFAAIAVLLSASGLRPGLAALLGLACGLVVDSLAPAHFGAGMLAYSVVAFGAAWLRTVFFDEQLSITAVYVAAGKWLIDAVLLLVGGGLVGATPVLAPLFLWSPLAALATAGVAVLLLVIVRPFVSEGRRPGPGGRRFR